MCERDVENEVFHTHTHIYWMDGGLEKKINKFFPMAVDKSSVCEAQPNNYKKEFFFGCDFQPCV